MGATSPSHKKGIFSDNINKELFHNIGDLIKEMKLKIKIMDSKIKILENIQYTITSGFYNFFYNFNYPSDKKIK